MSLTFSLLSYIFCMNEENSCCFINDYVETTASETEGPGNLSKSMKINENRSYSLKTSENLLKIIH